MFCTRLHRTLASSSSRSRVHFLSPWTHSRRSYHELAFLQKGDPNEVLEYHRKDKDLDEPPTDDGSYVRVEMMSAPWNPADKNTVQGVYPSPLNKPLPQPPSIMGEGWRVAGSEGWGRVVAFKDNSSNDSDIAPGMFVTLGQSGMGTFRSSLWLPQNTVIPVDRGDELETSLGGAAASSLFQLGGTAWRMLHDFESLGENRVVIQNAGNSGVGWMISQLAATQNLNVISLVRRGSKSQDQFEKMVDALTQQSTNTTRVIAEEDLLEDKEALKTLQSELGTKAPRLAINAVGGPSAGLLLKLLAPGGTMVTYGGLSMKPVTIATPMLIFKDLKVKGYWHSRWMVQSFPNQKKQMINELVDAVLDGGVQCPPVQVFPLSSFKEAFQFETDQSAEAVRRKIIFDCEKHEI